MAKKKYNTKYQMTWLPSNRMWQKFVNKECYSYKALPGESKDDSYKRCYSLLLETLEQRQRDEALRVSDVEKFVRAAGKLVDELEQVISDLEKVVNDN